MTGFLICLWVSDQKIPKTLTIFWRETFLRISGWHNHCVKSVQIQSFFWSVFCCIRTEYGDLRENIYIYKYRKTWTRNNSVFGHFSRSDQFYVGIPPTKKGPIHQLWRFCNHEGNLLKVDKIGKWNDTTPMVAL